MSRKKGNEVIAEEPKGEYNTLLQL